VKTYAIVDGFRANQKGDGVQNQLRPARRKEVDEYLPVLSIKIALGSRDGKSSKCLDVRSVDLHKEFGGRMSQLTSKSDTQRNAPRGTNVFAKTTIAKIVKGAFNMGQLKGPFDDEEERKRKEIFPGGNVR
jgi:hypothetical protein